MVVTHLLERLSFLPLAKKRPVPFARMAPVPVSPGGDRPEVAHCDAQQARIRDHYIRARFPGLFRTAAELESSESVIQAARLLFEEDDMDAAFEVVELCLEQGPNEPVRLAGLALSFLVRDAMRFAADALRFRAAHPDSAAWEEIARLGRALVPGNEIFRGGLDLRGHDEPWPDLPHWIHAPRDLTVDGAAAHFHRAMSRGHPK